MVWDTKA